MKRSWYWLIAYIELYEFSLEYLFSIYIWVFWNLLLVKFEYFLGVQSKYIIKGEFNVK